MRKYILIISLLWISLNTELSGQINQIIYNSIPKEIQPSPEASGLGMYGNTKMNLSTGSPSISIPLYEIKIKDYLFPIGLSYNASGIKVDDIATWVGLGWSLNVGGSITRSVNDMPDEKFEQKIPDFNTSIDLSNSNNYNLFKEVAFFKPYDRKTDTQLDQYHYNFMGYSGKFVVKSGMGLEYIYGGNGGAKIFKVANGFEITMSDGFKYCFTEIEKSSVTSQMYGGPTDDFMDAGASTDLYNGPVNSTWYLTSIISPTNIKITLKYKTTGSLEMFNFTQGETIGMMPQYSSTGLRYQFKRQTNSFLSTTYTTNQIFLSEIEFPNGTLVFESKNGRKDNVNGLILTGIKVYDINKAEIRRIDFNQDYFTSTKGSNSFTKEADKYRLKLLSVSIGDQLYKFNYKNEILPMRYSFAKDWQGYYNGSDNNEYLLPRIDKVYENEHLGYQNVSREPNLSKMQACALDLIYYPTGGYTKYDYENHKIKEGQDVTNIGGLRLKSSKEYDSNGNFLKGKSYEYNEGKLNGTYVYKYETGEYTYEYQIDKLAVNEVKYKLYTLYSNILHLSPNGPLVTYTDIYEYSIDANNNKLGSIYYNYSFKSDGTYSSNDKSPYHFTDNSVFRGNLLKKEIRDNNNQLKHKQVFAYSISPRSYVLPYNFYIKPISYPSSIVAESTPGRRSSYYKYWWMPIYSYTQNPFSEKEVTYIGADSVIVEKQFYYRSDNLFNKLTNIDYTSSIDGNVKITYEYPFGNESDLIKEMVNDKNFYPLMGEKIEKNTKITKYTKISYDKFNSIFRPSVITENIQTAPTYNNITNYLKYDKAGNPLHIKTTDNIDVVYLWSYGGIYPLAEIKKATYQQVANVIGENFLLELSQNSYSAAEISNKITLLKSSISGVQIQTYSYPSILSNFLYGTPSPTTIKECFKYGPNNKPIYVLTSNNQNIVYIWGSNGEYPFIEIKDATYEQVENAIGYHIANIYQSSSISNEVISRLYQSFPNAKEQVTTYSYPSELSKKTINTTSKEIKKYLNYDSFGNPIYLSMQDETKVVYIWGYNGQYPIAEIRNATYDQVKAVLGVTPESLSSAKDPDFSKLTALRTNTTLSAALITTYKYKLLVGMTESTDPRGITTYYSYDNQGRLTETYIIENNVKKMVQANEYHYQNQ